MVAKKILKNFWKEASHPDTVSRFPKVYQGESISKRYYVYDCKLMFYGIVYQKNAKIMYNLY